MTDTTDIKTEIDCLAWWLCYRTDNLKEPYNVKESIH